MKFYIDSAEIEDILEAKSMGIADGVTTNPTLIMKSGRNLEDVVGAISKEVDGPIFTEVISTEESGILEEGYAMAKWADQVVIKIPSTVEGIKAARKLELDGIPTGITLIFSPMQALLAAKAGASYLIPFVGRLDDISLDGMEMVEQVATIIDNYPDLKSKILAASLRNPLHILQSSMMGVDIVTAPLSVYKQLAKHPLTDNGIAKFLEDWKKVAK